MKRIKVKETAGGVKISIWLIGNKHTHLDIISGIYNILQISPSEVKQVEEHKTWTGEVSG